jgi:hypothetical protein
MCNPLRDALRRRTMCCVTLVLVLGVVVPGMGADEKIYWVADDIGGGDSDQDFVDLLTDAGYTVDMRFSDQELRVLDDTKLELLNRADLIIISRDSDSRQYDDGDEEKANWNRKIARPILNLNAFYMQANRWNWVPSSDTWHYAAGPMRILEPDHPVMEGVTIDHPDHVPDGRNGCRRWDADRRTRRQRFCMVGSLGHDAEYQHGLSTFGATHAVLLWA